MLGHEVRIGVPLGTCGLVCEIEGADVMLEDIGDRRRQSGHRPGERCVSGDSLPASRYVLVGHVGLFVRVRFACRWNQERGSVA
jgi:hypothetical protein